MSGLPGPGAYRGEVWIDPHVLELAGLDWAEIEEWTEWAEYLLERGWRDGDWPAGLPVVSDRGPNRGPNGERYALLGFRKDES